MPLPVEEWFFSVPVVTRTLLTAMGLTTLLCHLKVVSPLTLVFRWDYVVGRRQWWRLVTTFLYSGPFSLNFVLNLYFLSSYARMLEEGTFRRRTADFIWLILLGACSILFLDVMVPSQSIRFLNPALTSMIVYIWARRHPTVRMNLMGLLTFQAPFLPFVMLALNFLLGGSVRSEIMGMLLGHFYYYFEFVWPSIVRREIHFLRAPAFFHRLFEPAREQNGAELATATVPPAPDHQQDPVPHNNQAEDDHGWEDLAHEVQQDDNTLRRRHIQQEQQ